MSGVRNPHRPQVLVKVGSSTHLPTFEEKKVLDSNIWVNYSHDVPNTIQISPEYKAGINELADFLKLKFGQLERRMSNSELTSFTNRRGSMVVDVVASRQRKYEARVVPLVAKWEKFAGGDSLIHLLDKGTPTKLLGLRIGEAETIKNIASNFLDFGERLGIGNENEICARWAHEVEDMRFAYELDPIVGSVKGIGLALFNYMRMLSGADSIKPDVRIKKRLNQLGFKVPKNEISVMYLCELISKDLQISLLELDQLLWFEFNEVEIDNGEGMLFLKQGSNTWKTIDQI